MLKHKPGQDCGVSTCWISGNELSSRRCWQAQTRTCNDGSAIPLEWLCPWAGVSQGLHSGWHRHWLLLLLSCIACRAPTLDRPQRSQHAKQKGGEVVADSYDGASALLSLHASHGGQHLLMAYGQPSGTCLQQQD